MKKLLYYIFRIGYSKYTVHYLYSCCGFLDKYGRLPFKKELKTYWQWLAI